MESVSLTSLPPEAPNDQKRRGMTKLMNIFKRSPKRDIEPIEKSSAIRNTTTAVPTTDCLGVPKQLKKSKLALPVPPVESSTW